MSHWLPHRPSRRPEQRLTLRTAVAVALALAAGCATATPGAAHTRLVGTDPEDGARLRMTPVAVVLRFSEPLDRQFVRVRLAGPGSAPLPAVPRVTQATLTVPVPSRLSGRYTVAFRVVSKDGHPVSGTVSFVVTGPPAAAPSLDAGASATATTAGSTSPPPRAAEPIGAASDGVSTGLLGGLGVVVLALGAVAWLAVGRRRR